MARVVVAKNIAFDDIKNLYYVTMDYGKNELGKRIKITKTFKDEKDAKKALKIFEGEKAKQRLVMPTKDTLRSYSTYWLTYEKAEIRDTTKYGYENILNKHLLPYLGDKELQKITKADIYKYFAVLKDKGLSNNTLRKHYDLLKSILTSAEESEKIYKSPMRTIKPLKTDKFENEIYTPQQVIDLFNAVKDDRLEIAVKLGMYLGIRRGEVCGLKWNNIHFDTKIIDIIKSRIQAGGRITYGDVKSKSSERTLKIPSGLLPVLKKVKAQQEEDKNDFGSQYHDDGFVFTWSNGTPYRPNYLSDMFSDFLRKNNLPHIRFHDLRHTFGNIAIDSAPLREVSKAMGHNREDFTDKKYLKDSIKPKSVAVDAVNRALNSAKKSNAVKNSEG